MTTDDPSPPEAARAAIRHWRSLPQLAEFAASRHGYGDTDGGFGVTYPGDLDECDREVLGESIPPGYVAAYGFWGPPDGYQVVMPEADSLAALAAALADAGFSGEADSVRGLIAAGR